MDSINLMLKYRPKTFNDFQGQEKIKEILENQIIEKRNSFSYLFYGNKGSGKTSMARIFAKAINCLDKKDKPCNKCDNCINYEYYTYELDGASNNSVENIREIIDNTNYNSIIKDTKKIFIIDEVHMLSKSAFNAFLKTLEEPEENIVFILITTEIDKIPETIISRCQTFPFFKIPNNIIEKRVIKILEELKINYQENEIKLISDISNGSLRDAINLLERSINKDKLDISFIKDINTIINPGEIDQLINCIEKKDIQKIQEIINNHKNLNKNFVEFLNLFLEKSLKIEIEQNNQIIAKINNEIKNVMIKGNSINNYNEFLLILIKSLDKKINVNTLKEEPKDEIIQNNFNYENILKKATKKHLEEYKHKISKLDQNHRIYHYFSSLEIKAGSNEGIIIKASNESEERELMKSENINEIKDILNQVFQKNLNFYPVTNDNWKIIRQEFINKNLKPKKNKNIDVAKKIFGDNLIIEKE